MCTASSASPARHINPSFGLCARLLRAVSRALGRPFARRALPRAPPPYATNDWARPVTVAPSLRAAERPHGLLSPSLLFLNLTQKHTAQLAALRAAYMRTFARRAAAPPPTLLVVGPVRETPPLPAALATASATVFLYHEAALRTAGGAAFHFSRLDGVGNLKPTAMFAEFVRKVNVLFHTRRTHFVRWITTSFQRLLPTRLTVRLKSGGGLVL